MRLLSAFFLSHPPLIQSSPGPSPTHLSISESLDIRGATGPVTGFKLLFSTLPITLAPHSSIQAHPHHSIDPQPEKQKTGEMRTGQTLLFDRTDLLSTSVWSALPHNNSESIKTVSGMVDRGGVWWGLVWYGWVLKYFIPINLESFNKIKPWYCGVWWRIVVCSGVWFGLIASYLTDKISFLCGKVRYCVMRYGSLKSGAVEYGLVRYDLILGKEVKTT